MSSMSVEEANIAAQIAQLEAELERAKLENQLKKLQSQLKAIDNDDSDDCGNTKQGGSKEYLVIEDDYEYNEEDGYYEEEYIEEYEEEYYTDEEYEEVVEEYVEEYIEDEEVVTAPIKEIPEQNLKASSSTAAPKPVVYNNLQQAHSSLRKTPNNVIQQEVSSNTAPKATAVSMTKEVVAPLAPALVVVSKVDPVEKTPPKPKTVTKVRPPPSQGGKPNARVEPQVVKKTGKIFPLSGLIRKNNKTSNDNSTNENDDGTYTNKVVVAKRGVPKKPQPVSVDAAGTTSSTSTITPSSNTVAIPSNSTKPGVTQARITSFQRRMIPNIQPSTDGNETIFEQILGPKLLINAQLQKCTTRGCMKDQELIGLYFGAAWKSDCKRFMKLLKEFYSITANQHNFDIVYISADRSLIEFKDVYKNMPYLALPAGTTSYKNELTKSLKIIEMPSLVILDDEANVVSVQGVQRIMELDHSNDTIFAEQCHQLIEKWKKTRPISFEEVKKDNTLLYNTIDRGTVYWN